MPRKQLKGDGGRYFASGGTPPCFGTGCAVLDRVVGGGYPRGRMVNIVGDKSTGKTGMAIEACANFRAAHPDGRIFYNETEAAFDLPYAQGIGLPVETVEFPDPKHDTVQQFARHLEKFADALRPGQPGLYIVDSLDALDDADEIKKAAANEKLEAQGKDTKGSYGTGKARAMSALFRRVVRKLERTGVTLIIISQVRDKIGVMFGERHTRTGGRAIDFYATWVLWLSQVGKIEQARGGVKRKVGVDIRALCKKNKIGKPYRDCDFSLMFDYGIDDVAASVYWLHDNGYGKAIKCKKAEDCKALIDRVNAAGDAAHARARAVLAGKVRAAWDEIEARFAPPRRKYGTTEAA